MTLTLFSYNRFMSRRSTVLLLVLSALLGFSGISSALAHPADVYAQDIHLKLAKQGLSIRWEIKPGPMLVSYLWFEADVDADGTVSLKEAQTWAGRRIPRLSVTLDGRPLPLHLDEVQFPVDEDSFQAGLEFITFILSAAWPQEMHGSFNVTVHNTLEEQKSLNWYFVEARDGYQFLPPEQHNSLLDLEVISSKEDAPAAASPQTDWDSSKPSLLSSEAGPDLLTQASEKIVPELEQSTPQDILLNLVREQEFSISFYAFALGISLVLGALHALTPGHGKTVVAAYLVGSRGTTRHAVALGSVVTLTHTGSVFLLGVITLAASQYILPTSIIPMLEIVSGLLILGLGFYLLIQRIRSWWRSRQHQQAHAHGMDHDHNHDHDHGHSQEISGRLTWRSLIALGVSGGLVPCPDAIAILLVAVAIKRILLGLALILSFSLGLAVVLIVIGLLMVNSRRLFDRMGVFERMAPIMPIVSALVVLALGFGLTWGATVRAGQSTVSGDTDWGSGRQVLYLAEDGNGVTQLFITDSHLEASHPITQSANRLIDYAVSPDQSRAAYIVNTADLRNEIRLIDLATFENWRILDCGEATCSQPIWSPDGMRLVFEHLDLSGENPTGLATLWWIEVDSGGAQPVFQESQLPGANPRWSPDGRWISYATPQSVRLYNLESGETHVIDSILGSAAEWSPDSGMILYRDVLIRENRFVTQLFLYDLEARESINLLPDAGFENILAAWSPDGNQIAVVRRDLSIPRGDQVWLMNVDGSDLHVLTNAPAVLHGSLNWFVDGDSLVVDVYALDAVPMQSTLEVVEVDGGGVKDLDFNGYNPRWLRAR